MSFTSVNPYSGEFIASYNSLNQDAIERCISELHSRQKDWRKLTIEQRGAVINALAASIHEHKEQLAQTLTAEMGKPINAARAEIDKCVQLCNDATHDAIQALAPQGIESTSKSEITVQYQPLGVLLAIMPWNFPHWQAIRFAIPALLAGNAVVVKPAESVAGSAALLEKCIRDAEVAARNVLPHIRIPFSTALIEVADIASVISDSRISGVTLTGSDRAGRSVAEAAGKQLKKVVLELGGSDPFIVLSSANIKRAAHIGAKARSVNSGQSCIAAKRFIVVESIYDSFIEPFVNSMRELRTGDPTNRETNVGPIATKSVYDQLVRQVNTSVEMGAQVLLGGAPTTHSTSGYIFPPTVLVNVPMQSPAAREELFGPVASVFKVKNIDEAIQLANDTPYGLGASVWTEDTDEASKCILEIDAGMVFVNEMVASNHRYPFGGIKQSGVGRELGEAGFREFTNVKTVYKPGLTI